MGTQAGQLTATRQRDRPLGALRASLIGWLAGRIAVGLGFLSAHALSGSVNLPDGRLHLDQGLMTWDGTFYKVITEGWYGGTQVPGEAARFFPGYPALARLVDALLPGGADVALLVIANVAAFAAAVLLWQLTVEGTGEPRTADRAAWMLGVIPAANVMVFAYSESLMLLIATGVLLAVLRRRPGWAVVGGIAAGLLRPAGVLLALPVAVEAWRWYRGTRHRVPGPDTPERTDTTEHTDTAEHTDTTGPSGAPPARVLVWVAAVVAPLLGLGGSLWIVSRPSGDVLEAYRIQRQLRDGFRDPLTRLAQAGIDFAGGHLHDVYNVAFALGFAALFVVALRHRQRLSWLVFMAVTWLVAVGGNNMDSVGRYCVVAAPFTIALAQWSHTRSRMALVAGLGTAATAWFTTEVLLGRIIP